MLAKCSEQSGAKHVPNVPNVPHVPNVPNTNIVPVQHRLSRILASLSREDSALPSLGAASKAGIASGP